MAQTPQSPAGQPRRAAARAHNMRQPGAQQGQQPRGTQGRRGAQRRRQAHRTWWRRYLPALVTVAIVALIVGIFVVQARSQGGATQSATPGDGTPAPAGIVHAVALPDPGLYAKVGTGGLKSPFQRISGADVHRGATGEPEVFYAGADYCPFCAAERWSLVMALGRFGTFNNLHLITSADAPEAFPGTNTFTFVGATYTSQYLDFSPVEGQDRNHNALQIPAPDQQQQLTTYDQSGSIPFISVANQYSATGAGYSPEVLKGLTWQQIAAKLSNPDDPVTRAITGNANYVTAAICQVTNQQPANVCAAAPIPQIEQQLTPGK